MIHNRFEEYVFLREAEASSVINAGKEVDRIIISMMHYVAETGRDISYVRRVYDDGEIRFVSMISPQYYKNTPEWRIQEAYLRTRASAKVRKALKCHKNRYGLAYHLSHKRLPEYLQSL